MINKLLEFASSASRRLQPSARKEKPIILSAKGKERGCVAISYITWPFREGWDSPKARGHTNAFEVVAMAEAYRDLGFRVEVVDWGCASYVPPPDCRIAIDIHGNLERWHVRLPPTCKTILHATGPHWLFSNNAELNRLQAVQARKGIALKPRRQAEPSRGVEVADEVVVLGNEFTKKSFVFGGKPVTRVPISSAYDFPWPERRDVELARKKFLWVGSYGMVHKGLDLALDAFAEMPDLELTVCGRPEKEEDFYGVYESLLRKKHNIQLHGWLDMASPDFMEIAQSHATIIYPGSAEGGAGSVIHCMHAGMLPACTTEASVDLGDFGVHIKDGTVDAVRAAARRIASMSTSEVAERARKSWEHVRDRHTRDQFRKNYANFAARVVEELPA